jgi:hypothetical protein
MKKLRIDGLLFCVIACAACTGDSTSSTTTTGGGTADPFVGKWACSEAISLTFTSPPGASPINETEMTTISIAGSGGALAASKETDSGSNCKLSITSSGSSASLNDGQTCTTKNGISIAYKAGSATVTGNSMNSTFDFDASGTISHMGMMVAATANGTQTSTCSRLTPPPSPTTGGSTTGGW